MKKQKYNKIDLNGTKKYGNLLYQSIKDEIESFDNNLLDLKINIKHEYDYTIEGYLHESDLIKIYKILQGTPYQRIEALVLENGYYILTLNTTQLTYILKYFLQKEMK